MNQTEEMALLTAIDNATTATGNNVQKVADNVQVVATTAATISDEIDKLIASGQVSPEVAAQLTALSSKTDALATASQASSDALDAQVPVLVGIASKGSSVPVPVEPPPPPPGVEPPPVS